jgi:hypothetical protein
MRQHEDLFVAATGEYLGRLRRASGGGGDLLLRRDGSVGLIVPHPATGGLYAFDCRLDLRRVEGCRPVTRATQTDIG